MVNNDNSKVAAVAGLAGAVVGAVVAGGILYSQLSQKTHSPSGKYRGPRPKKCIGYHKFGKVPGETRGDGAMDKVIVREDPYAWMRDESRKNPEVLAYIAKENAYTDGQMKKLKPLEDAIYNEFLSHMEETDQKVPYPYGGWYYYTRTVKGLSYPLHCRRKDLNTGAEEVMLDVNELSKGHEFCDVASIVPSPDHALLAYAVDFTGYETYEICFKDLKTGALLQDKLEGCADDVCWGADNSTAYYLKFDSAHRPYQVWLHVLGTPQSSDKLIYEDHDALFNVHMGKTNSDRLLLVESSSTLTTESAFIDLRGLHGGDAHKNAPLVMVQPRMKEVRYGVEHFGDDLYIVTNANGAKNYKIVKTPIEKPGFANWKDVFPYDEKTKIQGVQPFKDFIVILGRQGGLKNMWIYNPKNNVKYALEHPDPVFVTFYGDNYEYDTKILRYTYSSMTTPRTTIDFDMVTKEKQVKKVDPVPNYRASDYCAERIEAKGLDGTMIPISIVYNKQIYPKGPIASGPCPFMLYGYGSYGICIEPQFNSKWLSYLDRGICYAIGHIRGGGELGAQWYEDGGRFLTKKNTFDDFIRCAEHLIDSKYTSPDRLAITGRSAGGMLMGTTINMRPDLFKACCADVPFVDCLNTVADPTLPLSVGEWEEWGNPNLSKYFYYLLEYSPYENVRAQRYPSLLVTGGLHDSRVPYWEPVKWVAKIRDVKTDDNPCLLKIDLGAGHFSASDRYKNMREMAFEYAFVVNEILADGNHAPKYKFK